jgi:hypothetical protein
MARYCTQHSNTHKQNSGHSPVKSFASPLLFFRSCHPLDSQDPSPGCAIGRVGNIAVYSALGMDADGKKDAFGIWIEQDEGAKFSMNRLQN